MEQVDQLFEATVGQDAPDTETMQDETVQTEPEVNATEMVETPPAAETGHVAEPVSDKPAKSFLVDEPEPEPKTEGRKETQIPVHVAQKLRAKYRQSEEEKSQWKERAEFLEQQLSAQTQPAAVIAEEDTDGLDELDDDDIVTKAQAQRLAIQTAQKAIAQRDAESAKSRQVEQTKAALLSSEQAIRQTTPDYDTVIATAIKEEVLLPQDRQAAYQSKNPARTLYLLAKRNLEALGLTPQAAVPQTGNTQPQPQTTPPTDAENDDALSDEEWAKNFLSRPLVGG